MKTVLLLCIFSCLFVVFSCSQKNTSLPPPVTKRTVKPGDTIAYAIIEYKKEYRPYLKNMVTSATLSKQETSEIEKLTSTAVARYNTAQKRRNMQINNILSYYRQYIPAINANGEKEVFVNCFCDAMGSDWQTSIVIVRDGGSCFFQFKINLKTKRIRDFYVNGEA
ncbi:hypothetical protein [Mucilaginibacter agri]|uniref:Lipoprotein n=1 Tax=Mucilaginibacter agri TaxID=2695265 RepID=A0A965ZIM9_9SPHI|nr:hypothetical protein [Mucilaginibacter agri]NCD70341.1 hypothetical protein [Mucilaginibacter agri]